MTTAIEYPAIHPFHGASRVELLMFEPIMRSVTPGEMGTDPATEVDPNHPFILMNGVDDITGGDLWTIRVDWQRPAADGITLIGYQRPGRQDQVAREIAAHFQPELLGLPKVARRTDGSLWFIDGQGRGKAIQTNYPDGLLLMCEVFTGITQAEEAAMFNDLHEFTQKISSNVAFSAAAVGRDGWERDAKGILAEYHWHVGHKNALPKGWVMFNGSQALKRLHKKWGNDPGVDFAEMLRFACIIVSEVFPEDKPSSSLFGGIAETYARGFRMPAAVVAARLKGKYVTVADIFPDGKTGATVDKAHTTFSRLVMGIPDPPTWPGRQGTWAEDNGARSGFVR